MYSRIITSPFGKRETVSLFTEIDGGRIIGHIRFIHDVQHFPEFIIHVIDLCKIMSQLRTGLGHIDIHRRKRQFIGIKLGGIAFVPRGMRLVGGNKQTEWRTTCLTFLYKLFNCFKIDIISFYGGHIRIEGENRLRFDMRFADQCHPVALRSQMVNHTLGSFIGYRMVGVCTAMYRPQTGIKVMARRGRHRDCLIALRKTNSLRSKTVDIRCLRIRTAVAS